MRTLSKVRNGIILLGALAAAPAGAATISARTYVSGLGSDNNPCAVLQPCRTLQNAVSLTAPGGEIVVLNSADYGPVVINKALTITSEGATAGILSTGAIAITINAGAADAVNLRGLEIDGGNAGATGIQFNSGLSLTIQKSVIRNFSSGGITISTPAPCSFLISDTAVANVAGNAIAIAGQAGASGALNRVTTSGSGSGVYAVGTKVSLAVIDGVASNNAYGIAANGASVTIRDATISGNTVGVQADQSAIVRLVQSTITSNGTGVIAANSAQIQSFQNNSIAGNGTDGAISSTVAQR
jgi:hypothetical protein